MPTIRVIELFAGIGSQAEALNRIGADWESAGIVEIDPYCVTAYNAIHGTKYKPADITKIESLPDCDLLTYSFPCTDISTAGKQKGFTEGSGTRSALVWEVLRLLKAYGARGGTPPKYLIMENVKALVQKKFRPLFDEWVASLNELGYTTYWQVLNATDYGIPQNRERVIAVSILNDDEGYEFPKPEPLKLLLKDVLEPVVDEKYYITVDAVNARLKSNYQQHKRSIIGGGTTVPNPDSERVERTDVCRAIRVGGRGSRDEKHRWDIVVQEREDERNGG